MMLKNYFTTAFRHLIKHKNTALINIIGLALGISCLLIILVVVRYELSFDQFHSNPDQLYRVVRVSQIDGEAEYSAGIAYPLPDALKSSLATLQEVTALQYIGNVQLTVYDEQSGEIGRQFQEDEGFVFADTSFFDVFDFKGADFQWIAGNPETALKEAFSVVLTESLAKKYFPEENPIGKTIKANNRVDLKVSGVVSDFPDNTDFPFRILTSYEFLKTSRSNFDSDWVSIGPNYCYVKLKEGVDLQEVEQQIFELHSARVGEEQTQLAQTRIYKLQPLEEVHTDTRFENLKRRTVSQETIWALAIIGLFLIGTAGINFVNLTTAQAVMRSKEVGIRKVMGSGRKQLIIQFLGETFLITLLAATLALGVAEISILYGGELLQVNTENVLIADPFVILTLAFIIMAVTLLAGIYPAFVLSGFNPLTSIKNKISGGGSQGVKLRWGLVTLQFIIAQVFIISTIVVIKQMDYFRNADMGFEKEAVISVRLPENSLQTLQTLENQWKAAAGVDQISFASTVPSGLGRNGSWQDIRRKGAPEGEENIIFEHQSIDEHYLDLYQIPLLAGRNFLPTDTMQSIIINRALAERAGFAQAEKAIGESMLMGDRAFRVVGVTENFHSSSLKEEVGYLAFTMIPARLNTASIKLNLAAGRENTLGSIQQSLQQIEEIWAKTYPEYVFDYQFLDERIAAYYREETRLSQLFKVLAGVTIFIGCLGLYGLIAFMAVRRTKEVGIRKVLGASVSHILLLFSKEFTWLILLAFCISGPLAFYLMQQWLENFTYQVDIGIGVFLLAILVSLTIVGLTVGYRSYRAAVANPVDSLRNE